MKLEQSFAVTASAREIEARIVAFMERNGYVREPVSTMTFRRGSRLGSYFSFSPRKWQTRATIAQQQTAPTDWQLTLTFEVNDEGQLVTQHERLYWKAELDELQHAIETGALEADGLGQQERALVSASVKGFALFLLVGVLVAVLVGLTVVTYNPQYNRWAIIAGACSGLLAGLLAAKRYWRT